MIANYVDLQDTVSDWLHRSDLNQRIPVFIALAEQRLNKTLRLAAMETSAALKLAPATDRAPLPKDFLEAIDLTFSDGAVLAYLQRRELNRVISSEPGRPAAYTIARTVSFDRPADRSYALRLAYVRRWAIAEEKTNWLIETAPDVYLYATLLEAGAYARRPDLSVWTQAYRSAVRDLTRLDARTRRNMTVPFDAGLSGPTARFDVKGA